MSVLVDTSVWVEFLSHREPNLRKLLGAGEVCTHPFIIGELATGSLKNRQEIFDLLANLPSTPELEHEEVMYFLEHHKLFAKGIGWVDMHLLACATTFKKVLWTKDKRLNKLAEQFTLHKNRLDH